MDDQASWISRESHKLTELHEQGACFGDDFCGAADAKLTNPGTEGAAFMGHGDKDMIEAAADPRLGP